MIGVLLGAAMLFPASASAFEGRATSPDGDIVVSYSVKHGTEVSVTVDTRKKKGAFHYSARSDVSGIRVEFVDLNADSRLDVIVRHEDESGYAPRVLINRDGDSFVNALNIGKLVYVSTEPEPEAEATGAPKGGYRLKTVEGHAAPDLVFTNVVIGKERYREATFRYDPATATYVLRRTGAKLGPLGEP
jgi:hypothetical protein